MVGNVAIIGMPGISEPRPYVLGGKELSYIEQLNDVAVEDGSIDYVDGRTVIDFTTSFEDWEPSSDGEDVASSPPRISLRGPTTFIWAHGKDGESRMGYHGPSQRSSRVINDMMMPSGMMEGGGMMGGTSSSSSSTTYLWLVHGTLAFVAWGLLAPAAISIAITQNLPAPSRPSRIVLGRLMMIRESIVRYSGVGWLGLHFGFNMLACAITVLVFVLAVSNVKRDGSDHFDNGHSKVGLAMMVLCLHQAIGGILRPSKDPSSSSSHGDVHHDDAGGGPMDEDGIDNEDVVVGGGGGRHGTPPMKSIARQAWELLHKGLGLSLFFLGTWQMHEGMTLYHERYDNSSYVLVAGLYIAWMAIWIVVVVGGIAYRWRLSSNAGGAIDEGEKRVDTEMENFDANSQDDAFPDAGSVGVTSLAGVKKMALSREISDVINAEEHVFL